VLDELSPRWNCCPKGDARISGGRTGTPARHCAIPAGSTAWRLYTVDSLSRRASLLDACLHVCGATRALLAVDVNYRGYVSLAAVSSPTCLCARALPRLGVAGLGGRSRDLAPMPKKTAAPSRPPLRQAFPPMGRRKPTVVFGHAGGTPRLQRKTRPVCPWQSAKGPADL